MNEPLFRGTGFSLRDLDDEPIAAAAPTLEAEAIPEAVPARGARPAWIAAVLVVGLVGLAVSAVVAFRPRTGETIAAARETIAVPEETTPRARLEAAIPPGAPRQSTSMPIVAVRGGERTAAIEETDEVLPQALRKQSGDRQLRGNPSERLVPEPRVEVELPAKAEKVAKVDYGHLVTDHPETGLTKVETIADWGNLRVLRFHGLKGWRADNLANKFGFKDWLYYREADGNQNKLPGMTQAVDDGDSVIVAEWDLSAYEPLPKRGKGRIRDFTIDVRAAMPADLELPAGRVYGLHRPYGGSLPPSVVFYFVPKSLADD